MNSKDARFGNRRERSSPEKRWKRAVLMIGGRGHREMIIVTYDRCDQKTNQLVQQRFEGISGFEIRGGWIYLTRQQSMSDGACLKAEAVLSLEVQ